MTDKTTLRRNDDGTFTVIGMGGYDGYLKREFDNVGDALEFLTKLWEF